MPTVRDYIKETPNVSFSYFLRNIFPMRIEAGLAKLDEPIQAWKDWKEMRAKYPDATEDEDDEEPEDEANLFD